MSINCKHLDIGDVVLLRSDGPKMTVALLSGPPDGQLADCVWFHEQSGLLEEGRFPVPCLVDFVA